jgi:hypothetical protein
MQKEAEIAAISNLPENLSWHASTGATLVWFSATRAIYVHWNTVDNVSVLIDSTLRFEA